MHGLGPTRSFNVRIEGPNSVMERKQELAGGAISGIVSKSFLVRERLIHVHAQRGPIGGFALPLVPCTL